MNHGFRGAGQENLAGGSEDRSTGRGYLDFFTSVISSNMLPVPRHTTHATRTTEEVSMLLRKGHKQNPGAQSQSSAGTAAPADRGSQRCLCHSLHRRPTRESRRHESLAARAPPCAPRALGGVRWADRSVRAASIVTCWVSGKRGATPHARAPSSSSKPLAGIRLPRSGDGGGGPWRRRCTRGRLRRVRGGGRPPAHHRLQ